MAMEREPPVEPDGMWGLEALSFNIRDGFVGTVCSHFSDSMWRRKICVCARKEHEASASEREMNKCVRVKARPVWVHALMYICTCICVYPKASPPPPAPPVKCRWTIEEDWLDC